MPTIFRTGGGGVPQWNVYTGLTAPPVKENGLWVALDINIHNVNLVFGTSRPENPADKTLYIAYTSKDNMPVAKPLRNVDEISYHIVSAIWYTTAGGWTGVDLYVVKDGEWVLHSKGEVFLYVKSGIKLLSKVSEAGDVQWSVDVSKDRGESTILLDVALDNVNGSAYVLYGDSNAGSTGINVEKIRLSDGSIIASFPSGANTYAALIGEGGTINLLPDRTGVVIISGTVRVEDGRYPYLIRLSSDLNVIKTDSELQHSGPNLGLLSNGKLRCIYRRGSASYGLMEIETKDFSDTPLYSFTISGTAHFQGFSLTTGESIFYNRPGSSIIIPKIYSSKLNQTFDISIPNMDASISISSGIQLIDDTILLYVSSQSFTGLLFASLDRDTCSFTEIRRVPLDTQIIKMEITPIGRIYLATETTVFRLNDDDTLTEVTNTQLRRYAEAFLVCDPCDRLTFPEYFS